MEKDSIKEESAKSSHHHHHHHKKDNVDYVVHVCIHQKFIKTNWQLLFLFHMVSLVYSNFHLNRKCKAK